MTRFVKDPAFDREMQKEPGTNAFVEETTVRVAAVAKEMAPHKTGYYERRIVPVGNKVRSRDPFWHLVEYGSVNNRAYAPLRRAVLSAGLRLDEAPRK